MNPEMSRREMLRTTGSVAAAAALGGLAAPADAKPRRRIRKAVKLGMVGEGATLREKFALLKELGFDGVELDSPNGFDEAEVVAARDATGLPIHGVVCSEHWASPLNHDDGAVRGKCVAAIETAIRDAKAYGATTVLVVPAVVNKQLSYADAWDRSRIELKKLIPLLDETGIRIAIENVWNGFLLSPLEAARYVDSFDSDRIGWYFDVGNIVNYGWPEQWIAVLDKRILKVDVKEFSRKKRDDEGLWKGFGAELLEGDCDWPAVMRALDAIRYQGWFTAEIAGGDRTRLAAIAERMDRIVAS